MTQDNEHASQLKTFETDQNEIAELVDKLNLEAKEINAAYADARMDLYKRLVDSQYQFAILVGVIAGFGFSVFSQIQAKGSLSSIVFWIGELLLIITIFRAYRFVPYVYTHEFKNIKDAQDRNKGYFQRLKGYLDEVKGSRLTIDEFRNLKCKANNDNFSSSGQTDLPLRLEPYGSKWLFFIGISLLLLCLFPFQIIFPWVCQI